MGLPIQPGKNQQARAGRDKGQGQQVICFTLVHFYSFVCLFVPACQKYTV